MKIRIGLLWHSANSGNLGVGALTVANMAILREVAAAEGLDVAFTIIGMRDDGDRYIAPFEADVFEVDGRSLVDPQGCWAVLGRQDCVIDIGAGDSFTDIYGPKRFAYLWLTKMMTLVRGRPLMLAPQTIGPFTGGLYRRLARMALEGADAVVARDELSMTALRELAPRAKAVLSADVAFALPYVDRSAERGEARLRVGVNVSGLLFNEALSGSNRFGLSVDYARLMRAFISDLIARGDVEIHLVSHVVAPAMPEDDDGHVAKQLHAEFPATILVERFDGPSEAKSYISSLDFLVAARMHACIAAVSSGVPVAPIAYSRKFGGLFGTLGYSALVPVTGWEFEQTLAFLHRSLDQRSELQAEAHASLDRANSLLDSYRGALRTLLRATPRRAPDHRASTSR